MLRRDRYYLKKKFSEYYRSMDISDIDVPEIDKREFGTTSFIRTNRMKRHQAFDSLEAVKRHLSRTAPEHVYYSTARYSKPSETPMDKKKESWEGSDLIFDIDADHLHGIDKNTPLKPQLNASKRATKKLIDNFLTADLGFDEDELYLQFSGRRGYHVMIRSDRVLKLDNTARSEIVDYITSEGMIINSAIEHFAQNTTSYKEFTNTSYSKILPTKGDTGWRGKIGVTLEYLIYFIRNNHKKVVLRKLSDFEKGMNHSISGYSLKKIYEQINSDMGARLPKTGNVSAVFGSGSGVTDDFIHLVVEFAQHRYRVEVDEPVTSDISRIIRFPHSLHGKTGLRVTPLQLDELNGFDPLIDAIAFSDKPDTGLIFRDNVDITIDNKHYKYDDGQRVKSVPECAAVFFVANKLATTK